MSQQRRYSVSDLAVLMSARPAEIVVVRKCLQPSRFADSEATALRLIVVDEVMSVLCNVARNRCSWTIRHLNAKAVVEVSFAECILQVCVIGMQFSRKIPEFRGTSVDSPVGGGEQIPVQVGHHVGTRGMITHASDGGIKKPVRSVIDGGFIRQEFRPTVSLKAAHIFQRPKYAFSHHLFDPVPA